MKTKRVRKTISIPEEVYKKARQIAAVRDQSFSAYVAGALQNPFIEIKTIKKRKIEFITHDLGVNLDNLDRDFIYGDEDIKKYTSD